MIYGMILKKGQDYYTNMFEVLNAIEIFNERHKYLITDHIFNIDMLELENHKIILEGAKFCDLMYKIKDFQWIWGNVFVFDKSIHDEDIKRFKTSNLDGNSRLWHKPLTIDHPLASTQIIAWDSSLTLIFSSDKKIIDKFKKKYPNSIDFVEYLDEL